MPEIQIEAVTMSSYPEEAQGLQSAEQDLVRSREVTSGAETVVVQKEKALESAKQALVVATTELHQAQRGEGSSREKIDSHARIVSDRIAADETLEPFTRTLHAIIYRERPFGWQEPDGYERAAERGRVALQKVVELAKPEVPVLALPGYGGMLDFARAARIAPETLRAEPPKIEEGRHYSSGGAITLEFDDSVKVSGNSMSDLQVRLEPAALTLMSDQYDHGLELLESIVANTSSVHIGTEAIQEKLEGFRKPIDRLKVQVALHLAGVAFEYSLDDSLRHDVQKFLNKLIYALATDTPVETGTLALGAGRFRHFEKKGTLSLEVVQTLTALSGTEKDAVKAAVTQRIASQRSDKNTSMQTLGQGLRVEENIDSLLEAVYA